MEPRLRTNDAYFKTLILWAQKRVGKCRVLGKLDIWAICLQSKIHHNRHVMKIQIHYGFHIKKSRKGCRKSFKRIKLQLDVLEKINAAIILQQR